jgi:hypothetical protein
MPVSSMNHESHRPIQVPQKGDVRKDANGFDDIDDFFGDSDDDHIPSSPLFSTASDLDRDEEEDEEEDEDADMEEGDDGEDNKSDNQVYVPTSTAKPSRASEKAKTPITPHTPAVASGAASSPADSTASFSPAGPDTPFTPIGSSCVFPAVLVVARQCVCVCVYVYVCV